LSVELTLLEITIFIDAYKKKLSSLMIVSFFYCSIT